MHQSFQILTFEFQGQWSVEPETGKVHKDVNETVKLIRQQCRKKSMASLFHSDDAKSVKLSAEKLLTNDPDMVVIYIPLGEPYVIGSGCFHVWISKKGAKKDWWMLSNSFSWWNTWYQSVWVLSALELTGAWWQYYKRNGWPVAWWKNSTMVSVPIPMIWKKLTMWSDHRWWSKTH